MTHDLDASRPEASGGEVRDDVELAAVGGKAAAKPSLWAGFAAAIATAVVATLIGLWCFERTRLSDVVMVYLLGIVVVSMRFGYAPALATAALSVLGLDVVFVQPYLTLTIADPLDAITIGVLFVVGVAVSSLTKRVRDQAEAARKRETRTARLYAMSRDLARTLGSETMLGVAVRHLHHTFDAEVMILLPAPSGELTAAVSGEGTFQAQPAQRHVAQWVWQTQHSAGLDTDAFQRIDGLFLPLHGSRGRLGVLGVRPRQPRALAEPDQRQLLGTFAALLGSSLEREQLAEAAQRAKLESETERLRSSLLSSVSHDLRTPLGVITGAASTLQRDEHDRLLSPAARQDLLASVREEAERLNRLVRNLLDMTRLASGSLRPRKQWHPIDEVVGVALNRLEDRLHGRDVSLHLPRGLPPVPIDAILIEQALINILENAIKHTPAGTPIEISATSRESGIEVAVADRGPGVPAFERERIFEKFHRLEGTAADGGAGLGLAICRGIIEAHGGRIWVEGRADHGAVFRFWLPLADASLGAGESWPQAS